MKVSCQGHLDLRNRRMAKFAIDILGKQQPGDSDIVRTCNAATHRAESQGGATLYKEQVGMENGTITELHDITWKEALDHGKLSSHPYS